MLLQVKLGLLQFLLQRKITMQQIFGFENLSHQRTRVGYNFPRSFG